MRTLTSVMFLTCVTAAILLVATSARTETGPIINGFILRTGTADMKITARAARAWVSQADDVVTSQNVHLVIEDHGKTTATDCASFSYRFKESVSTCEVRGSRLVLSIDVEGAKVVPTLNAAAPAPAH